MISLKAIQTPFSPNRHVFFQQKDLKIKNSIHFRHSKSNDSDSDTPPPPPPPPKGDVQKQELLAKIAMLQTQKVRLTDYLDERSEYLTQFAEEANAEIDQIGENALRELDEAGARIMENIESKMQAFEETSEMNKQEIEKNEDVLVNFEGQIQKERNEGLFFKNLGESKAPIDKAKAMKEAEKIKEVTKKNADSETRKKIYLALIGLIVIGIIESFISSSSDWGKSAILAGILVGLISQLTYEQKVLSETDKKESKNRK